MSETTPNVAERYFVVTTIVEEVVVTNLPHVMRGVGGESKKERKVNEVGKAIVKDKVLAAAVAKGKKALDIIAE